MTPGSIFLKDPPLAMPGEPMFGGKIGEKGAGAIKMMTRIMTRMNSIRRKPRFGFSATDHTFYSYTQR